MPYTLMHPSNASVPVSLPVYLVAELGYKSDQPLCLLPVYGFAFWAV